MDSKIIELLSEEIRETRSMTFAIKEETLELRRMADAAQRKADAAWELVVITREDMKKPFWKKWFGY
jgi:hypothetical protein